MNIYSIYTDSSKKESNPILIRQGFYFWAGFFGIFWALYNRMWLIAFLTLIVHTALATETGYQYIITIALFFIYGFFASEWYEYYAKKRGFVLSDIIIAQSDEEAEVKYYMREKNNVR